MSTGQRGRQVNATRSPLSSFYWVLGALVLLGAGFLVVFALRSSSGGAATGTSSPLNAPVGTISEGISYQAADGKEVRLPAGLYYKGNPDAKVKVVAYEDFQCPACAVFASRMGGGLNTDYVESGKVQFIFHDFPLSQHANAPKAAEAARCAGDQGKFWPMHDLLYARQDQWSEDGRAVTRFIGYGNDLGLDSTAFQACINDGKYTPAINEAGMAAQNVGIPATPTFVVNGKSVQAGGLRAAIDAALQGN